MQVSAGWSAVFVHHYNECRPHGPLEWDVPMATLARRSGDDVLGVHT